MGICNKILFRKIFDDLNPGIQRFLLSKGLNSSEAEDIVQETFIKLWNKCDTVEEEKVKPFVFTIASNLAKDLFRKNNVRLKYKNNLHVESTSIDGQYELEYNEFKEKLEKAIDSMPEKSKEVFVLSRFENLSYKEISKRLEIGQKAIEKRMGLALKHLYNQNILKKK